MLIKVRYNVSDWRRHSLGKKPERKGFSSHVRVTMATASCNSTSRFLFCIARAAKRVSNAGTLCIRNMIGSAKSHKTTSKTNRAFGRKPSRIPMF